MKRIASLLGFALLAACAATTIKSEWKADDDTGPALKKILVVGVTERDDVRRVFEHEFAAALEARGTDAVPSYTTAADGAPESAEQLRAAVAETGADGVLLTRLVKVDKQMQRSSYAPPVAGPINYSVYGYYPQVWVGFYDPPRASSYDVVVLETRLYRVSSEKLVWAGGTETFSPSSDMRKEVKAFSKVIIDALAKAKLLYKKPCGDAEYCWSAS